jgi:hypothetical protein
MIQRLYFPELALELTAVSQPYVSILKFIHNQHIKKMEGKEAWVKSYSVDEYLKLYAACHAAVLAATEKMVRVIDEHTK